VPCSAGGAPGAANPGEAGPAPSDDAAARLARLHGWADPDVARAVLDGCGGDPVAADACLRGMRPGAAPGATPSPAGDDARDGVYRQARRPQAVASRECHKARRRAHQLAAAGDRGGAAAERRRAEEWGAEARRAGAAAAGEVFGHVNAGRGMWEVDLHGLHADEAVAALAGRVEVLEEGLQAERRRRGAGEAAARGGTLRVVVGVGHHSRGGEATVPRAVQAWLRGRGLRHVALSGAFEVPLGRQPARGGGAAGVPGA